MMCVCMHVCKGWCVYACMYPKDGVEIPWYLVRYDRTEMTRAHHRRDCGSERQIISLVFMLYTFNLLPSTFVSVV
jgi:hypothetical protein